MDSHPCLLAHLRANSILGLLTLKPAEYSGKIEGHL